MPLVEAVGTAVERQGFEDGRMSETKPSFLGEDIKAEIIGTVGVRHDRLKDLLDLALSSADPGRRVRLALLLFRSIINLGVWHDDLLIVW